MKSGNKECSHSRSICLRGVEIAGKGPWDLRIAGGRVVEWASSLPSSANEETILARGAALLPGLHDHHLHLFSLAAALVSVPCGPPEVANEEGLSRALGAASRPDGWIRGVGYHESVAGILDRKRLDRLVPSRPVRIQHRSGALWMFNSRAMEQAGLAQAKGVEGAERDERGELTGRFFRLDEWLRSRIPALPPSLAAVGALLARAGVTGVSDASASNGPEQMGLFRAAIEGSELPQRLQLMGQTNLPPGDELVRRGPVKILLDESAPPPLDELIHQISGARAAGRGVAIHCVTRGDLFLALAGLEESGAGRGARIEHASVAPPEAIPRLAALGASVVTQPGFVAERGDDYLRDVDANDLPFLYRLRSLDEAGIPLAGGTDAPYGNADPWSGMRSAVERRTRSGRVLGPDESLTPERALALFSTPLESPWGAPRRIEAGMPADLCLLHLPWREARIQLSSELVAATFIGGRVVWRSPGLSG